MADQVRRTIDGVDLLAMVVTDSAGTSAAAAIGNTDDAAWDGSAADASVISLLKKIAINTTPTVP